MDSSCEGFDVQKRAGRVDGSRTRRGFLPKLHSHFSGNVVPVNTFILQEHVKTAFVLGQRMTCNSVNELFKPRSSLLNEGILKNALISTEGKLSLQCLSRQWRHNNLAVSLQLILQPLEVAVSSSNTRLLQFKNGKICLHPDFVSGEAIAADSYSLRVVHVDFQKVAGRAVGVRQVLRFRV